MHPVIQKWWDENIAFPYCQGDELDALARASGVKRQNISGRLEAARLRATQQQRDAWSKEAAAQRLKGVRSVGGFGKTVGNCSNCGQRGCRRDRCHLTLEDAAELREMGELTVTSSQVRRYGPDRNCPDGPECERCLDPDINCVKRLRKVVVTSKNLELSRKYVADAYEAIRNQPLELLCNHNDSGTKAFFEDLQARHRVTPDAVARLGAGRCFNKKGRGDAAAAMSAELFVIWTQARARGATTRRSSACASAAARGTTPTTATRSSATRP